MKCDYCGLTSNTLTFRRIPGRYKNTIMCASCVDSAKKELAKQMNK